jgi:peptidoglycan/xylan/chitin deacetylase (PgdA/CDA1 family)
VLALAAAGCGGSGARPPTAPGTVAGGGASAAPAAAVAAVRARPLRLPAALPSRRLRLPILMYHRIDRSRPGEPAITRGLTVAPADFAAQMRWLVRHGYRSVSERQAFMALEHGGPLPRRPVLISFDDGYRDVLRYAAPLLARLQLPATAFVITGRISGADTSFLRWGELRRLERLGVEIGSHTVSHPDLTALGPAALTAELVRSRRALEAHLHHPVQWLAYPAGRFDGRVVAAARRAGYVLAATTQPGSTQLAGQPLELHRFEVLGGAGPGALAGILGG